MEYCEFPNLKILISRNDPVLEQYVGNILIDVAEALEHVHDKGFLHYDFIQLTHGVESVMLQKFGYKSKKYQT